MNRRQEDIAKYIAEHGQATLAELTVAASGCSSMTLWRDLKYLEETGRIIRTHGGARSVKAAPLPGGLGVTAGSYADRAKKNTALKNAVAKLASRYVQPGKSMFFDSGSTIMALVEALAPQRYSIITYGANIAIALSLKSNGGIYSIGGEVDRNTLSCTGQIAEAALDGINIDTAIMTTSGFAESCGFTTSNMAEQAIKRAAITKAPRVVMLLDSSKFGKIFPFSFAGLDDVDVLITDARISRENMEMLEKHNVKVEIADCPEDGQRA